MVNGETKSWLANLAVTVAVCVPMVALFAVYSLITPEVGSIVKSNALSAA